MTAASAPVPVLVPVLHLDLRRHSCCTCLVATNRYPRHACWPCRPHESCSPGSLTRHDGAPPAAPEVAGTRHRHTTRAHRRVWMPSQVRRWRVVVHCSTPLRAASRPGRTPHNSHRYHISSQPHFKMGAASLRLRNEFFAQRHAASHHDGRVKRAPDRRRRVLTSRRARRHAHAQARRRSRHPRTPAGCATAA